jgi:hypothetical protein
VSHNNVTQENTATILSKNFGVSKETIVLSLTKLHYESMKLDFNPGLRAYVRGTVSLYQCLKELDSERLDADYLD